VSAAAPVFSRAEGLAWAPPERLLPSEWAEKYRVLSRRGSAEPGRLRLDRTPYAREVLDCLGDLEHTEVVLIKAAQEGGTEVAKSALGYWIDSEADNILAVLPNEKAAAEYMVQRIQPLAREPRLERWQTGRAYDFSKAQLELLHLTVFLGWSGSAQSLASRSIRYVISDEVDKAQDSDKEASALDLARDRLITFGHRAKHFVLSTPTTKQGPIWRTWDHTPDKRHFHVPCPDCAATQVLEWKNVRWEKREAEGDSRLIVAEQLLSGELRAWIVCAHCGYEISEGERMRAVESGHWVSALGPSPRSRRVAFHISALYSPWVPFARTVYEFLVGSVEGDLRNFWNSYLGLPQDESTTKAMGDVFTRRAEEHRPFLVPEWATCITAGADTQAEGGQIYWYYVVRAWGAGYRSRLLSWGKARSSAELLELTVQHRFPYEEHAGRYLCPSVVLVDSGGAAEINDGNTTEAVYRLALACPSSVVPVKGYSGRTRPDKKIKVSKITYSPPGSGKLPLEVLLHTLDTGHFKDLAVTLIQAEGPVMWEESNCVTPEYVSHMSAEEKARVRLGRGSEVRWVNNTRRRCDVWDASIYCLAGAHMIQADRRGEARESWGQSAAVETANEQRKTRQRSQGIAKKDRGPWINKGRH